MEARHLSTSHHPLGSQHSLSQRRHHWLELARQLLWELFERARLLDQLHPRRHAPDDIIDHYTDASDDCDDEIIQLHQQLLTLEHEPPHLGATALFGLSASAPCPPVLHSAIVALTLCRLSTAFDGYTDTVGEVTALAAADQPSDALSLRDAFRENGVLRPFVHLERRGNNIDHWKTSLTEAALCRILAQQPDAEQVAVSTFAIMPDMRRRS